VFLAAADTDTGFGERVHFIVFVFAFIHEMAELPFKGFWGDSI